MKTLLFILLTCGQPDLITVVPHDAQPYHYTYEELLGSEKLYQNFISVYTDEETRTITLSYPKGLCT